MCGCRNFIARVFQHRREHVGEQKFILGYHDQRHLPNSTFRLDGPLVRAGKSGRGTRNCFQRSRYEETVLPEFDLMDDLLELPVPHFQDFGC